MILSILLFLMIFYYYFLSKYSKYISLKIYCINEEKIDLGYMIIYDFYFIFISFFNFLI